MSDTSQPEALQIKKYPNRRYYDATRRRHVTLHEVYDLVRSGQDVHITDSRTNSDITNHVLLQMILENDRFRLDLLPSRILHQVIRSNLQVLRSSLERFIGPFMETFTATQRLSEAHFEPTTTDRVGSTGDSSGSTEHAFSPPRQETPEGSAEVERSRAEQQRKEETLEDLRRRVAELTERIDRLGSGPRDAAR